MNNERIKELAKQAMIFSLENGGWRISTHVPNDFQEKFAELIVKECMVKALEVGGTNDELIEPIWVAHSIINNIKEHFGVEE